MPTPHDTNKITYAQLQTPKFLVSLYSKFPSGYFTTVAVVLVTLLSVPTAVITSWLAEHAFYGSSSFGWEAFGELALPLGACIFAAIVFLARNPMHALLSLLGVFFSTVLMYLTAGIAFVGLVFLIVYVGAVAVLFLFVIMLLNVKSLTSADKLIRHISQVAAIGGVIVLLYQLHCGTAGALDRFLVDGFSRDAIIELTTGDAIFMYVRFVAMDINALTGLYTIHAILFLVITAILLAALLGAIILATVTAERATSITDIHSYSGRFIVVAAAPLVATTTINPDVTFFFDCLAEVGPTLFSLGHIRVGLDREIQNRRQAEMRKTTNFFVDSRPARFDSRISRRRFFIRKVGAHPSLGRHYARALRALSLRKVSVAAVRTLHCRPKTFRVYAAAALAPVMLKLLRRRKISTILRRRWLWHWRRSRAAWLYRVGNTQTYSKAYNAKRLKADYLYAYMVHLRHRKYPMRNDEALIKYYAYDKIIFRLSSPLRFSSAPLQRLRFLLATRYLPVIHFYAGRLSALCLWFLLILPVIPSFALIAYIFIEDYDLVWKDSLHVYRATYSWLPHLFPFLPDHGVATSILTVLLLPLVSSIALGVTYAHYVVIIALVLAYDVTLMHGGELSDIEFHESRCDFWKKQGHNRGDKPLPLQGSDEAIRIASIHPDKGRKDFAPAFLWGFPTVEQLRPKVPVHYAPQPDSVIEMPSPEPRVTTYFDLFKGFMSKLGAKLDAFLGSAWQLCRCLYAWIRSFLPKETLFEKYPLLADAWHQAVRPAIVSGVEAVQYFPEWLRAVAHIDRGGFSLLMVAVFAALTLYCLSKIALCLLSRRVYPRLKVRRPRALPYCFFLIVVLFFWVASYDMFTGVHQIILGGLPTNTLVSLTEPSLERTMLLILIGYALLSIYIMSKLREWRSIDRFCLPSTRPFTFRAYFNFWAKKTENKDSLERCKLATDLEPYASEVEALAAVDAERRAEENEHYHKERAKLLHYNLVMYTYIPKYYVPHDTGRFCRYRWPEVFLAEQHQENYFHSK
jgi:NADH:ubiquinone oxidoreductase subunit 6 (subunit J)